MSYCGTRNFRVLCFSQLQLKRLSINCSNSYRCWSLIRWVNEKSSRTWLHTRSYLASFIGSLITAALLVSITEGMYHATLELTKKKTQTKAYGAKVHQAKQNWVNLATYLLALCNWRTSCLGPCSSYLWCRIQCGFFLRHLFQREVHD